MFLHNPVSNAVSQPLLLILMSLTRFQLGFISLPSNGSIVSSSNIAVSAVKCLVTSLLSAHRAVLCSVVTAVTVS